MRSTILLLLVLFFCHTGQSQDTNRGTFKIARCQAMIAGKLDNLHDTVPHPHIDTITIAALLSSPEIKIAGCSECEITSFESIMAINGLIIVQASNGNKFTPQMIDKIKQLPIGSTIVFDQVRMKCPGANSETIPGKNFLISKKN